MKRQIVYMSENQAISVTPRYVQEASSETDEVNEYIGYFTLQLGSRTIHINRENLQDVIQLLEEALKDLNKSGK